jgi:VWFA-related protein
MGQCKDASQYRRLFLRSLAVTLALAIGVTISPLGTAQESAALSSPHTDAVEVDAVVVDNHGLSVRGLHKDDFQIRDRGAVAITSFTEVSTTGLDGPSDARYLVLLLDDSGVGPMGTVVVQNIARLFLSHARSADHVAVVRLTHHDDPADGDLQSALERVDEYRARSIPYFGRETNEEALHVVTKIARQLEPVAHRRKTVVCIGRRAVCDLYLGDPHTSLLWPSWRDALTATARANVSVYVVDPAGMLGRFDLGDGIVDQTGGTAFVASSNFTRAADLIWGETGHYYLLGYTPSATKSDLHTIDVHVKRRGLTVHARRRRGD